MVWLVSTTNNKVHLQDNKEKIMKQNPNICWYDCMEQCEQAFNIALPKIYT